MPVCSPPVRAQISRGNNYIRRLPPLICWTYFRHDKPELSIRIRAQRADNTVKTNNMLTDRQIADLKDLIKGKMY